LVNTEPTAKPPPEDSDEELPTIDELRSATSARRGSSSPKATFIKHEIDDDEGDMNVSFRVGKPPPSASPDAKRKLRESDAAIPHIELDATPEATAETAAKAKRAQKQRKAKKHVDKKPIIQTIEDRAEYERHMEDVAILANELGGLQGNLRDKGKGVDVDGDVDMGEGAAEVEDKKSGRLYLFQFPPVLPELYNPAHGIPKKPAEIRAEQLEKEEEERKKKEAALKPTKGKGKAPATTEPENMKFEAEPVIPLEERKKTEEEEKRTKRQGFVKEEGYIGKLVVRESGRVELCWGGTSLLIGRGVDAGFLTTGVVVDSQERGPPGGGPPEGRAMSMGQIMGKFVVTPDWQKMS
jgi:DNA-directed RNA polymerase III subunit RPC4